MKIRSVQVAAVTALLAVLAGGALISGPASATSSTQIAKEKAAIKVYAKSMAQARAAYFAQVKPSRAAVAAVGKPAEVKRRATVAAGLATFNAAVRAAKAPSLAAQIAYRSAAAKSAAAPNDQTLRALAKSSLNALSKATAALKVDANVAAAKVAFAKVRAAAMAEFKATVAASVAKRNNVQVRAMAKFKAAKAKALAKLKVSLKAARAKPAKRPTKTQKK